MSEYEVEPIPGLPGHLPPGEHILWQGAPDWRALARTAFHTRLVMGYFILLVGWAMADALSGSGDSAGIAMTALAGVSAVALLHLLAWGSARTSLYTLTNRRIVMRIGMAVPKCINVPLGMIESAGFASGPGGAGDMPLTLAGAPKLGFLALWPHVRPWRLVRPEPMIRAVPDGAQVAALIARTCLAVNPAGTLAAPAASPAKAPAYAEAAAA